MEIQKSWKLIFILYITHPLLGCDVRWFRSDCQDNYRCSNESWYKRDSVVSHCEDDMKLDARALSRFPHDVVRCQNEESLNMSQTNFNKSLNTCPVKESVDLMCFSNITNRCDVRWFGSDCQDNCRCSYESQYKRDSVVSHCEDDRKLDARALSRFPHDVVRNKNGERLNMSQTNFTKSLNTCPVKESVELMCCSNITNRSTDNGTTKPDLVYTFQVDQSGKVISVCFILIREKTDKAKILLNVTETNDKELGLALTSDADEMKLYIQPGYIIIISDTYPLFYNFTGVTLAGSFEKFRVGKKDAQDFNLKNCDRSGKCFDWNEKRIIRVILIIVDLKETSIAVIGVTIFIATVYFLNFWQRRRRLNQFVLNLQQQIAAFQQQAAPAG